MNILIILLLITACILIILEMVVPGFGFFGISGIVTFLLGMILTFFYVPSGAMFVLLEIFILLSIIYILYYYAKKTGKLDNIILSENSVNENANKYDDLVGKSGSSTTPLKPFGKVIIEEKSYEVSSIGEYVSENVEIIVKYIKDSKIYVDKK